MVVTTPPRLPRMPGGILANDKWKTETLRKRQVTLQFTWCSFVGANNCSPLPTPATAIARSNHLNRNATKRSLTVHNRAAVTRNPPFPNSTPVVPAKAGTQDSETFVNVNWAKTLDAHVRSHDGRRSVRPSTPQAVPAHRSTRNLILPLPKAPPACPQI